MASRRRKQPEAVFEMDCSASNAAGARFFGNIPKVAVLTAVVALASAAESASRSDAQIEGFFTKSRYRGALWKTYAAHAREKAALRRERSLQSGRTVETRDKAEISFCFVQGFPSQPLSSSAIPPSLQ